MSSEDILDVMDPFLCLVNFQELGVRAHLAGTRR